MRLRCGGEWRTGSRKRVRELSRGPQSFRGSHARVRDSGLLICWEDSQWVTGSASGFERSSGWRVSWREG